MYPACGPVNRHAAPPADRAPAALQLPTIPLLPQVFLTQTHLAIAMEYAQGGDMFKYICRHKPQCRLLESQARWIFQQLIIGLDYCHNKVPRRRGCISSNRQLQL